jgi:hypothetical protein
VADRRMFSPTFASKGSCRTRVLQHGRLAATCPSIGDPADPGRQHHYPLVARSALASGHGRGGVFSESLVAAQDDGAPVGFLAARLTLPGMLAFDALPALSLWVSTR